MREFEEMRECMSHPTHELDEEVKEDSQKSLSVETSGGYGEEW